MQYVQRVQPSQLLWIPMFFLVRSTLHHLIGLSQDKPIRSRVRLGQRVLANKKQSKAGRSVTAKAEVQGSESYLSLHVLSES